jgi:DNA-binding LacI/PurR family transcriptional regulator
MPAEPTLRPSLRSIARASHVSAMTVSRVLRNIGSVAPRKATQIRRIAEQLGYRPDPQVAKLMHHLRVRRSPAFQASICALTTQPVEAHHPFFDEALRGARQRSEALGYGFDLLHVKEAGDSPGTLQRILQSRGVEGLVLLPMANTGSLENLLDWSEFSVVAATSSVTAPAIQRVTPHHFANTLLLCRELAARGYRRPGVVHPRDHDRRVGHTFTAAANWHNLYEADSFIEPLIFEKLQADELRTWFEAQKPDVIVAHNTRHCQLIARILGLRIPGRIGFAANYTTAGSEIAGIDELPMEVGASAASQIATLIQRGEKGIPSTSLSTMILGRWVEGKSCRGLRRRILKTNRAAGGAAARSK